MSENQKVLNIAGRVVYFMLGVAATCAAIAVYISR